MRDGKPWRITVSFMCDTTYIMMDGLQYEMNYSLANAKQEMHTTRLQLKW